MKYLTILLFATFVFAQDTTSVKIDFDYKFTDYNKVNTNIDTTKANEYKTMNMKPGLHILFDQNKAKVIVK